MVLTIEVNDNVKNFFVSIIKLIYDSYKISHVNYEKQNYFNCSNMWSGGKPNNDHTYCHYDLECNGYEYCESHRSNIFNDNSLIYVYNRNINYDDDVEEFDDCNELVKQIYNYLIENDDDDVIIKFKKSIILKNKRGINKDHRGSDHVPIKLPFYSKIELGKTVTLKNLIDACYKIKSHKFDYWYELYCGVSSITKVENKLNVYVDFDHGS